MKKYYLLEVGDVTQDGDECWFDDGGWRHFAVKHVITATNAPVRRAVPYSEGTYPSREDMELAERIGETDLEGGTLQLASMLAKHRSRSVLDKRIAEAQEENKQLLEKNQQLRNQLGAYIISSEANRDETIRGI